MFAIGQTNWSRNNSGAVPEYKTIQQKDRVVPSKIGWMPAKKLCSHLAETPLLLPFENGPLRKGGSEVISVGSEAEARLEIEMGRCGVLLVCTNVRDLMRLFRQNCPNGRIIFVRTAMSSPPPKTADYVVEESEGPEAIVEVLRSSSGNISKKAS